MGKNSQWPPADWVQGPKGHMKEDGDLASLFLCHKTCRFWGSIVGGHGGTETATAFSNFISIGVMGSAFSRLDHLSYLRSIIFHILSNVIQLKVTKVHESFS